MGQATDLQSLWPTYYVELGFHFNRAWNTISNIVPEIRQATIDVFGEETIDTAVSSEEWLKVSRDFLKWWNMANALGAVGGKLNNKI